MTLVYLGLDQASQETMLDQIDNGVLKLRYTQVPFMQKKNGLKLLRPLLILALLFLAMMSG